MYNICIDTYNIQYNYYIASSVILTVYVICIIGDVNAGILHTLVA